MKRREFITLLGAATAWPLAARAQQTGKMSRIGYLGSSSPSLEPHYVEAFREKLRDLGHVDGENIAIEYRRAEGQDDRLLAYSRTPGDDALGVVSPAAIFWGDPRQRTCGRGRRVGLRRGRHGRNRRRCGSRLSCAATRPHRPFNFTWSMRRSRPSTVARPRWRQPRYWNRRGNPCEPLRRGGKRRHDVWPPNSASPFRPRDLASRKAVWREPRAYWRTRQRPRS